MVELTIDQALQKGIEAHKAGQVQEADRLYTAILNAQPKHSDANHNMGVLAVGVGKVEQALPFFKTALEANSAKAQLWLSYIDALIKLGRLADAKAVLDQAKSKGAKGDGFEQLEQKLNEVSKESLKASKLATEAAPQQPNILETLKLDQAIKLAKNKSKEGAPEEAKKIYQDILSTFPKNKRAQDGLKRLRGTGVINASQHQDPPQEKLQELINLYSQRQIKEALERVTILLQEFPHSGVLYSLCGTFYKKLGQFGASVVAYNRALLIMPDHAEIHYNLGNAFKELDRLDDALNAYHKSLAIKSDYAEAYNNIGTILQKQGKLAEALTTYNKALTFKPNYPDAHINKASTLRKQGKLEAAVETYKKAIAIDPDCAVAYYNMGNSFKDQGECERALEAYKQSLVIKPDHVSARYNMAVTLQELGRLEEANLAYRVALDLKPDHVNSYYNMGAIFQEQGRLEEAITAYHKALAINPDHTEAKINLSNLANQLLGTQIIKEKLQKQLKKNNTGSIKTPRLQIQQVLRAFLHAEQSSVLTHLENYNRIPSNMIAELSQKDQVFCSAYYKFLSKLTETPSMIGPKFQSENTIYHLGESHCLSYAHKKIKFRGIEHYIIPKITFGAKAFHFSKKKENAYKAITEANFNSLPNHSKVFISFGEIDCRPTEGIIAAAAKLGQLPSTLIDTVIEGYLNWFAKINQYKGHDLSFFNIPAPTYQEDITPELNDETAKTIVQYNYSLAKYLSKRNFRLIDVHCFTADNSGFSNKRYHIDSIHLGPKAIQAIEPQLL